ncbi:DUF397 domain-containing protein [Streptomyces sp. MZ04]|nr:DUF397 domain-containing protein [Streptomyces sp. MZ04]TGA83994.1 DUF397 domain-containing protein [Streptomyces sp. MZ04]
MSRDLDWFKSSYSGDQGECVEAALSWNKSSYSGGEGECVEAHSEARLPPGPPTPPHA